MRIGELSAKYESNGNPAAVAQDSQDAGGWSYGIYQFSSAAGKVQDFVNWLCRYSAPYDEYGKQLAAAGDPTCDQNFIDKWQKIGNVDADGFAQVQDDYVKPEYFDAGAQNLIDQYGFDISGHNDALKGVLWSNCVQHGPVYGAEVFKDGADLAGQSLDSISEYNLIYYIYEVKLTDPSWSSGSPADRPGLFSRWQSERQDALNWLVNGSF